MPALNHESSEQVQELGLSTETLAQNFLLLSELKN
jgi:hypothetical protein